MTEIFRSWPWWRWLLTGMSALALALSAYLGWHFLVGGSVIGCAGGSSCDQVLNSRWSSIGGVAPVSGLAAGAYLAMLAASLSIGRSTPVAVQQLAWRVMLVLVGSIGGSAAWFTIIQKWIIGSFCVYCMITHAIGVILTALVIWRASIHFKEFAGDVALIHNIPECKVNNKAPATPIQNVSSSAPWLVVGQLTAIGLALAGIMAACQLVIKPRAVYHVGESKHSQPTFDPRNAPLVGSPDALYIVSLLFDYKCPHCQQMHFLLDEVIRRYNGKLAFVLCPTPLSRQCNPYIPREVDEYKGSCDLAKVGIAVWMAKREAFPDFNRWMFSLESGDRWRPRNLDAAKAKAVELVGKDKFDAAQTNPWIDQYIKESIRIYAGTIQGGNAVPKLVYGSRWIIPEVYDAMDLISILQEKLAMPKP